MVIFDSHIHIGQFYEKYYSPEYIASFLKDMNIQKAIVSSTTICEENYEKVISEITELIQIAGNKIFPMLWITPKMLKEDKHYLFLESDIDWKCIKVHGFIHNWHPNGKILQHAINIASELKIPFLFHTGGIERCDAGAYLKTIERNSQQQFILAHGRPVKQAIEVLSQCSNAWVDTAFMPIEDIKTLVAEGFIDRVLFGTDFPITIHNEQDLTDVNWYQNRTSEIIDTIGEIKFKKINEKNFIKIFCYHTQPSTLAGRTSRR